MYMEWISEKKHYKQDFIQCHQENLYSSVFFLFHLWSKKATQEYGIPTQWKPKTIQIMEPTFSPSNESKYPHFIIFTVSFVSSTTISDNSFLLYFIISKAIIFSPFIYYIHIPFLHKIRTVCELLSRCGFTYESPFQTLFPLESIFQVKMTKIINKRCHRTYFSLGDCRYSQWVPSLPFLGIEWPIRPRNSHLQTETLRLVRSLNVNLGWWLKGTYLRLRAFWKQAST